MLELSLSTLCEERKDAWAPFSMSAPELSPVADKLDDGVACRGFALDFAGDFARALVFVYADRRHKLLLPDQRLDAQTCLQHRDGDHPMGWIATAGRGARPDACGALGDRLDIDDLMATIRMEHCRERMLPVTVDDVPEANAIPVVQADPHPGPLHMRPERWRHLPPLPIEPGHAIHLVALPVDDDGAGGLHAGQGRSEEHTSELQSRSDLVCRL